MNELKKHEVDQRKIANQEDEIKRKVNSKREQLLEFQTSSGNRERSIA
jgi:hypothetical protein